jgi:predicted lipid-binding transport protein (Tim44 family)
MQGAWTRKNLDSIRDLLSDEMYRTFKSDLDALIRDQRVNRLENISIRTIEPVDSWTENENFVSSVRFMANLLDYTVDERTSRVVEGSDSVPVKFEEIWTFRKPAMMGRWQLIGIEQV